VLSTTSIDHYMVDHWVIFVRLRGDVNDCSWRRGQPLDGLSAGH
jgi:hypothetical protein